MYFLGIKVYDEKVKAIQDWPKPTSVGNVRSLYGLTRFYRRLGKDFCSLDVPLTKVIKKKWEDEQEKGI